MCNTSVTFIGRAAVGIARVETVCVGITACTRYFEALSYRRCCLLYTQITDVILCSRLIR